MVVIITLLHFYNASSFFIVHGLFSRRSRWLLLMVVVVVVLVVVMADICVLNVSSASIYIIYKRPLLCCMCIYVRESDF